VGGIGTPDENGDFFRDRSPISHYKSISTPLLIFQGADDPRVPPEQSKRLASRLKVDGKVCTCKIYPDEGHGFRKRETLIDTMSTGIQFLDAHLL